MENASKALIIAGSVIISIMIIALGVGIFNRAQNLADTPQLDSTEINMFNQSFERYSDTQLGSQVKSMISFAISNASTNKDEPTKLPSIEFQNAGGTVEVKAKGEMEAYNNIQPYINQLADIRKKIVSTTTYIVECNYASTGLIDTIIIKVKT